MALLDEGSADSPSPASGSKVRILILDDEPDARDTLQSLFVEKGYQVQTAATGQEALEKAGRDPFDIAILDVRLPDMNGTEVLVQMKELQPHTRCIMVTGYPSLQTSIRAANNGAFAYVLKPLDIDHLFSLTDQALEQQRSGLEHQRLLDHYRGRIRELEAGEAQLTDRVQRLEQELAAARGPGS